MKVPRLLLGGTAIVVVLSITGYGTSAVTPQRSASKATVVPPASFVGTSGADTLVGTDQNENLAGRGGPDLIRGKGGNDVLRGGAGNDRLFGGPGRDILLGDAGRDRLSSRDGARDTVQGGAGFDEAWVDRNDVVRGVERIHRQ
jgi:Ca2+-binding RTX toxin-like protein